MVVSLFDIKKTNVFPPPASQWVPEITHHCPKTPFLLVGTQIDLRDDPSTVDKLAKNKQKPITLELAEKLARDLKAVKYVECSALTQVKHSSHRRVTRTSTQRNGPQPMGWRNWEAVHSQTNGGRWFDGQFVMLSLPCVKRLLVEWNKDDKRFKQSF